MTSNKPASYFPWECLDAMLESKPQEMANFIRDIAAVCWKHGLALGSKGNRICIKQYSKDNLKDLFNATKSYEHPRQRKTYQCIVILRSDIPLEKATELAEAATKMFDNHAGRVSSSSTDPYVLIFEGEDTEWSCLTLGTLALEDIPDFLPHVSKCVFLEDDAYECEDMLVTFSTPIF